jgi:hypothetical protein
VDRDVYDWKQPELHPVDSWVVKAVVGLFAKFRSPSPKHHLRSSQVLALGFGDDGSAISGLGGSQSLDKTAKQGILTQSGQWSGRRCGPAN